MTNTFAICHNKYHQSGDGDDDNDDDEYCYYNYSSPNCSTNTELTWKKLSYTSLQKNVPRVKLGIMSQYKA